MKNNTPAIFITGTGANDRGTSLYVVLPEWTIRCSGANDNTQNRQATTFIRPYKIIYQNGGMVLNAPKIDFTPIEGNEENYQTLLNSQYAHHGHPIIEILDIYKYLLIYEDIIELKNKLYHLKEPSAWVANNGTSWDTAKKHVCAAINFILGFGANPPNIKFDQAVANFNPKFPHFIPDLFTQ